MVDYVSGICYVTHILAHPRGRLRRRAEGGAGSGVLRRRLVTAQPREARDPARQALRPGCEELALRIRRKCRRRKRGPRNRHGGAPRGERVPLDARRASPGVVGRATATRDNRKLAPFGAPLAPHGADGKEKSKTRAQQRAAGTKKTALFDIVNRNDAATRSVPAEGALRLCYRVV